MMRYWLPHLFVSIFALLFAVTGGAFLAMSPEDQDRVSEQWSSWLSPRGQDENATTKTVARLPPMPFIVWSTLAFSALAGFYLAAALAGFVNSREESL